MNQNSMNLNGIVSGHRKFTAPMTKRVVIAEVTKHPGFFFSSSFCFFLTSLRKSHLGVVWLFRAENILRHLIAVSQFKNKKTERRISPTLLLHVGAYPAPVPAFAPFGDSVLNSSKHLCTAAAKFGGKMASAITGTCA